MDTAPTITVDAVVVPSEQNACLQQFTIPAPSAEEALIRVEVCGICTPEQRVFKGSRKTYPYWGGHELCGIIEVPPASNQNLKGTRAVVALMQRCGYCSACRRGLDNHCAYLSAPVSDALPSGPRGFSTHVVVPQYKLFSVDIAVAPERAALTEPLACCLHSVRRARLTAGDMTIVMGAGTMGLLHTFLLRLQGCHVAVFDDDIDTHPAAHRAGAYSVQPTRALTKADPLGIRENCWGADAIFCTRGGTQAISESLKLASRGARIVFYQSITTTDDINIFANILHYRELELMGTIAQTADDLRRAAQIIADNPTIFTFLNVCPHPAEDSLGAFRLALSPRSNRVLIDFRD